MCRRPARELGPRSASGGVGSRRTAAAACWTTSVCPGASRSVADEDHTRNGTTPLFAALNIATGEVIGECDRRHRFVEFRKFLSMVDRSVSEKFEVDLVLDNCGTLKTVMNHKWLLLRPRYHLHFEPTSASWMNQVGRWFAAGPYHLRGTGPWIVARSALPLRTFKMERLGD